MSMAEGALSFRRVDDYYAVCGPYTISRVCIRDGWLYEAWKGNEFLGQVPITERRESWQKAVSLCCRAS
jgi:hypothetical protein